MADINYSLARTVDIERKGSDSSMADINAVSSAFILAIKEGSDSSMADINFYRFSVNKNTGSVQIPLWPILTSCNSSHIFFVICSDSSMADINDGIKECWPDATLKFRFLYGRY